MRPVAMLLIIVSTPQSSLGHGCGMGQRRSHILTVPPRCGAVSLFSCRQEPVAAAAAEISGASLGGQRDTAGGGHQPLRRRERHN